ncbi:MAG: hypothetical protein U9P72_10705 [Campylobacterota bacterium]|nr:hypothetical protein [Campylobacterota bacterium]
MFLKLLLFISLLFTFAFSAKLDIENGEYCISELRSTSISKDTYFNSLGMPDLYVDTKCYKDCKKNCCYNVLKNAKGAIVRSYSTNDSVLAIARNRYDSKSYLMFAHTYGSKKNRQTKNHIVDNKLREYNIPNIVDSSANALTVDGKLIQVNSLGVYKDGIKQLDSKDFESVNISNNPQGDITIAGIEKFSRTIYVSNFDRWINSNITLAQHSDKNGILSIYPQNKNDIYLVAYNLINIYNKGLMGSHVDFSKNVSESGWIYNYEKHNIGFDPEIYLKDKELIINASNSSTDKRVSFSITKEQYATIDENTPKRDGFEDESILSFMVGTGLEYLLWDANTKVDKDDVDYASSRYDISNSFYKKLYFQGRVADTQLAVSYMKSEAQEVGGLTKDVSDALNLFVDFNGLISESSVLRLAYTTSNINGITTFIDKNNGATSITADGEKKEFKSTIEKISLLLMQERGVYGGIEYTNFETPSTVGFSGSGKNIEYYGLDNNFGITNIELIAGIDTAAYAKRYETDLSKFYFQSLAGFGVSIYEMSDSFEKKIKYLSNKKIVNSDLSFVLDLEVQFGYLWQQRFKLAKGLGYSIDLGFKARGSYTGAGQSDDSEDTIEANELTMEMTRYDIWYGPYAYFNIMF